ncbi:MAG: hypothetical protein ABJA35_05610 [Parafilimonas sp.]
MKKTWIIISIIAVIIIGSFLYLKLRKSKDFEPLIITKLQQLVKDASNGLYVLNIDKIEVDVIGSTVKVHNAQLLIDSARLKVLIAQGNSPVDVYKISLSDLDIDGLNVDDLLNKKDMNIDLINIKNPIVEIYHPVNKSDTIKKDTASLYSKIQKSLGHFKLKMLAVSNINFIYHNISGKEKITDFKDVSMKFKDIEIDSLTQFDTTRFLYAKEALINFNGYTTRTADSLYFIKTDSLTINAARKTLDVAGLYLTPRFSKQDFGKQLKSYKDRYTIKFETAFFKNIDWYHLFLGEGFNASQCQLNNGTMEIYADRNVPLSPKSKVGNYPHQLLVNLDFPTNVDSILINNFKLTYTELNPKTQKTGSVVFDDINAVITNVTNIKENIAQNKILKLTATSKLMSVANLSATFMFDLTKTKTGDFTVDADLGPMNGTALNKAAVPLGLFEINSLSIKRLKVHETGNSYNARSSVFFVYDDLKITALKPDNGKLKHRGFLSFVANTFILNKSNKEGEAEPKYVSYKRDSQRSFFYLIWKSILKGITNTAS